MKQTINNPPRVFTVGHDTPIAIKDCARVELEPDEQVTFVTESGAEYDIVRKDWGFYATPSVNGRLAGFGWRTALIRNPHGRRYVLLMERGKEPQFEEYLAGEGAAVLCWLDSDADIAILAPRA